MRKTFIGPQLRRLRQERGETQAQMARKLGISTAYVNLLENNQRSVSVAVLLRLFEAYGVDWREIAEDDATARLSDLRAALQDPIFDGTRPDLHELRAAQAHAPGLIGGVHAAPPQLPRHLRPASRAWRAGRRETTIGASPEGGGAQLLPPPPQPLPRARGCGRRLLARPRRPRPTTSTPR